MSKSNPLADSLAETTSDADAGEGHLEADAGGMIDARSVKPYDVPVSGGPESSGPPSDRVCAQELLPGRHRLAHLDLDLLCSAVLHGTLEAVDLTAIDTDEATATLSAPNAPGGETLTDTVTGPDGSTTSVTYERIPGQWRQYSNSWLREEVARLLRAAHHVAVPDDLRAVFVLESRQILALLTARARHALDYEPTGDATEPLRGGSGTGSDLTPEQAARFGPTAFGVDR